MYVFLRSFSQVKICVRSEETSPLSTRASSIPSLHEESGAAEVYQTERQESVIVSKEESSTSVENSEMGTEENVEFCVADVRKRLKDNLHAPKKMFQRDPEDPSG